MTLLFTTIAVLLRILSNPLANVFQKQLTSRGNNPLTVNFITYFILSLICVVVALNISWNSLGNGFWLYSILGGIAGALGNGFLIKALQSGDLSVLGPINSYKSIVGMIVGIFLLGELPNVWGLIGIALIIYGSYFVLDTTEDRFTWRLLQRKEIQFRIWAMILTAIEAVFVKKVIIASSVLHSFVCWCWFGAFFSLTLLTVNKKESTSSTVPLHKHAATYAFLILCIGLMQLTTNYAFSNMPVGYALSLFQLSTIVSVLLGYRIFKEKNIRKKMIGSVIMIVGSVVIILLKDK